MSDPGDETRDPTMSDADRRADAAHAAEKSAAAKERSDRLFDLAEHCDNDAMREQAIDSLETVKRAHEPPPAEPWVRKL